MPQLELSQDAIDQPKPVSTDLLRFHNLVKRALQIVPSFTKMQTFLSVWEIQSVPPSLNTTQLKLGISPELTQILEAMANIRLERKNLLSHITRLIAVFNQISAENAQAQQDVQVLVAKCKQVNQVLQQLLSRNVQHSKLKRCFHRYWQNSGRQHKNTRNYSMMYMPHCLRERPKLLLCELNLNISQ